jgi:uncharacterized RmlC-like cupin family protein
LSRSAHKYVAMSTCKIIRHGRGEGFRGKQGLDYFSGVSAESTGAKAYMLAGAAEFRHGPNLEHHDRVEAGDFIYIPAGVPHQPFNPTKAVARALIARTDPNEQESVVLLK